MNKNLLKLLQKADFTEKEARVYLALLEIGQANVSQVAKIAQLKRSIIYVILEGLIKREYVNELEGQKINTYVAIDPSFVLNSLENTTEHFQAMLPILRTLKNKGKKRPKISYHENLEDILNIFEEMSLTKAPFFIANFSLIEKQDSEFINTWINSIKTNIDSFKGRFLIPDNPINLEIAKKFKEFTKQVKMSDELKNINMDFVFSENKLVIANLADEPFVVVIESEEMIKSFKPIFEMTWERGRELSELYEEEE